MTKLTGKGRPTMNTPGEVGQYYEDLNTGDIYECRRSSKYSPTHHAPVGGYWWELRAKGENIREHGDIFGGSGGSGEVSWNDLKDKPFEDNSFAFNWDGDTGKVDFAPDGMLYLISDTITSFDMIGEAEYKIRASVGGNEFESDVEYISPGDAEELIEGVYILNLEGIVLGNVNVDALLFAFEHDANLQGVEFKAGLYGALDPQIGYVCHLHKRDIVQLPGEYVVSTKRYYALDNRIYRDWQKTEEVDNFWSEWETVVRNGMIPFIVDENDQGNMYMITSARSTGNGYSIIECGSKTFYDNGHSDEPS